MKARERLIITFFAIITILAVIFLLELYRASLPFIILRSESIKDGSLYINDASLNNSFEIEHWRFVSDRAVYTEIIELCKNAKRKRTSSRYAYYFGSNNYSALFINEKYIITVVLLGDIDPFCILIETIKVKETNGFLDEDSGIFSLSADNYKKLFDLVSNYKNGEILTTLPKI